MKEIKKEITREEIVYEVTKEELDSIKREERIKGRNDVMDYIGFSMHNYHYKMNLGGMQSFLCELIDFVADKTITIQNVYGYSFKDYINKYK